MAPAPPSPPRRLTCASSTNSLTTPGYEPPPPRDLERGTCPGGRGFPAPENEFCWLENVRKHVRPECQTTSTSLRPLRCPKRATPSVSANSVSWRARDTVSPG